MLLGASLGPLELLWQDQRRREEELKDFGQLIGVPPTHAIHCLSDSDAHLRAAKDLVVSSAGGLCSVAIGAGVSLSLTNAHGEARFPAEMAELFADPKSREPRSFSEFVLDPGDGQPRTALEVFGGKFDGNVESGNVCASSERQA